MRRPGTPSAVCDWSGCSSASPSWYGLQWAVHRTEGCEDPRRCSPSSPAGGQCTTSALLVPTCGVLFGLATQPPTPQNVASIESQVGRPFDFVYRYHDVQSDFPNAAESSGSRRARRCTSRWPPGISAAQIGRRSTGPTSPVGQVRRGSRAQAQGISRPRRAGVHDFEAGGEPEGQARTAGEAATSTRLRGVTSGASTALPVRPMRSGSG